MKLRADANTRFPGNTARLKTGVYTALNNLVARKKVIRVPGGFQLAP